MRLVQVTKRKAEIREFSGWAFEAATKDKEWERAREFLSRFKTDALNSFLDILELPRGSAESALKVGMNAAQTTNSWVS